MTRYKLNPFLILYPEAEGLIVVDPRSLSRLRIKDPDLLQFLAEFDDDVTSTTTIRDRLMAFLDIGASKSEDLVAEFVEKGVLVESESVAETEEAAQRWSEYGWNAALSYYLLTREYPFIDYSGGEGFDIDDERMEQYAAEEDIPPIYKTYEDATSISLPPAEEIATTATIGDVLNTPHLEPSLSGDTIDRDVLSWLLYYSFGETGSMSFPNQGRFLQKTSPSGGARHPTEAYLAVFDVDDVPAGIYHYSVRDHALERLRSGDIEDELRDVIYELETEPAFEPAFVVMLTSVVERSMWRYREPRTYRVLLQDIGHVIETFKLACTARELYTYFGHGFHDERLESLLGLDGLEEPVFKFGAVGR